MRLGPRHRRWVPLALVPTAGVSAALMGLFVLISAAHPEERRDLLAAGSGVVLEDLEPIVVEVGPRGTDGPFHLTGRTFANAEELATVLRKLAQSGERASVRLGDDSR